MKLTASSSYHRKFTGNVCTDWRLTHDLHTNVEGEDGKSKLVKSKAFEQFLNPDYAGTEAGLILLPPLYAAPRACTSTVLPHLVLVLVLSLLVLWFSVQHGDLTARSRKLSGSRIQVQAAQVLRICQVTGRSSFARAKHPLMSSLPSPPLSPPPALPLPLATFQDL